MAECDIPVVQKTYDLYKAFHDLRSGVPKQDRYTLWQRIDHTTLAVLEHLLLASQRGRDGKSAPLEQASLNVDLLRVLVRLAKDTKSIDLKTYARLQQAIDEIGRMVGGWIRTLAQTGSAPARKRF